MAKSALSTLPENDSAAKQSPTELRSAGEPGESVPTAISELNRVVHEPARLAILTVLSAFATADFTFLQTATGLSKGNLSVQLTKLEEAGLTVSERTINRKRTLTLVSLTDKGNDELTQYWRQMERIRAHSIQKAKSKTK